MFSPYDYYITPEEYAIAESNGISKVNLEWRIRGGGWDKQRAITIPIRIYKDHSKTVALAKEHGIGYRQLIRRLRLGWDTHRAATAPITDYSKKREFVLKMNELKRKYPRIAIELASQNGIKYDTFKHRLRRGWDLIDAATIKPSYANGTTRMQKLYGENYRNTLWKWLFVRKDYKPLDRKKSDVVLANSANSHAT